VQQGEHTKDWDFNGLIGEEGTATDLNLKEKVENRCIEMVWFGGIGNDILSIDVIHVTLRL